MKYRIVEITNKEGSLFYPEYFVKCKFLFWDLSRWERFEKYIGLDIDGGFNYSDLYFKSLEEANQFIYDKINYPKTIIHNFTGGAKNEIT